MTPVIEQTMTAEMPVNTVAFALAGLRSRRGEGRGLAYCVRINDVVMDLLEAAKPADQSMVSFLKECAVTVSLQRVEASQK
jgi:hypothetical protein